MQYFTLERKLYNICIITTSTITNTSFIFPLCLTFLKNGYLSSGFYFYQKNFLEGKFLFKPSLAIQNSLWWWGHNADLWRKKWEKSKNSKNLHRYSLPWRRQDWLPTPYVWAVHNDFLPNTVSTWSKSTVINHVANMYFLWCAKKALTSMIFIPNTINSVASWEKC